MRQDGKREEDLRQKVIIPAIYIWKFSIAANVYEHHLSRKFKLVKNQSIPLQPIIK
jgi:hypothetical protein